MTILHDDGDVDDDDEEYHDDGDDDDDEYHNDVDDDNDELDGSVTACHEIESDLLFIAC